MDIWTHKEDCGIEWGHQYYPGKAVLITCDGEILFEVPDTWTDGQIYKALDICNEAYHMGKRTGEREKMREIKKALEI